jgi:predicted tellurium resistance membrane protein TerC
VFDAFQTAEGWISLLTLTLMEVVLGIDNIVFISILTGKLPEAQRRKASSVGLALALISRLGLLFAIQWVMGLKATLFTVAGLKFSGRHLILLGGGLFLLAKATHEIFERLEVPKEGQAADAAPASFAWTIGQILLLDLVFSLDSVITAVGMAPDLPIMVVAMVVAVVVMLVFAGTLSRFIERHPSMKILALSFLLLIGVLLVAEGLGQHIAKGYVYFAMGFALLVEVINMAVRKRQSPVALHTK